MMKRSVSAAITLAILTFGFAATAQQASATAESSATLGGGTTGAATAEAAPATVAAPAPAPAAAPAAAVVPAEPAAAAESDHDAMVGRLAVGYLGYVNIPYGAIGNPGPNYPANSAAAPVIGIRLWLNQTLGLDAGLGMTTTFGTSKVQLADGSTASTNAQAPTGLAIHFGMPLALRAAKHYAFQIIPEMNIGYAQQAITAAGANAGTDHSGLHFDLGARAGAEIHFGFMGIPELSLVGSVGLRLDINQTKTENRTGTVTTNNSDSRTTIGTTVGDNPWNIFVGNVSAFYYL